jgi:hypothetical protein
MEFRSILNHVANPKVQPANDKRGGGKEAYFGEKTAKGTFFKQTGYE